MLSKVSKLRYVVELCGVYDGEWHIKYIGSWVLFLESCREKNTEVFGNMKVVGQGEYV